MQNKKKKFSMPTAEEFLKRKRLNDPRGEPVWIRIEREMRENVDKKPYNEQVGKWLSWLRDYRAYQRREALKEIAELTNNIGPPWYCEFSNHQRDLLKGLKNTIHHDLVDRLPKRTRQSLFDIGITCKLPTSLMLKAMDDSLEDPGLFIWNLYKLLYDTLPTVLLPKYKYNQMLLMSSMLFIDLEECLEKLELLTYAEEPKIKSIKKKPCISCTPDVKLGPYLQTFCAPCYTPEKPKSKSKLRPFEHKVRVRTPEEYKALRNDLSFLQMRKERNMEKDVDADRVCAYRFWSPPSRTPKIPNAVQGGSKNPQISGDVATKLKMLKTRAKPRFKSPYAHEHYLVGAIVFCQNVPQFLLSTLVVTPTGYTPVTEGVVQVKGLGLITSYSGQWMFPPLTSDSCDKTCDCVARWERDVMNYLKRTSCSCGHYYDFKHKGKAKEKYFYPPTKYHPWWLDRAKIFQMDPTEDFIKDCVANALKSESSGRLSAERIHVKATGLSDSELLAVFFADLAETCLIIPHLPKANILPVLLNWTRNRVRGPLTLAQRKKNDLEVLRKWNILNRINFKATPYRIPFTTKELHSMTWAHRSLVQKLYDILLENFLSRNRLLQLKQSRYIWPAMLCDIYCDSTFLDVFFTYMPGRAKDIHLINPYDAFMMVKPNFGNICPSH